MNEALALYGELTGKTVLRPSSLPVVDVSTELPSPDTPEYRRQAPEAIVERFESVGVTFEPLGDKFVVVAPEGSTIGFPPPPPSVSVEEDEGSHSLPKGTIKFPGADLDQVLQIYSEFCDCTILRPASLPACTIHLRTESDLTMEETIYAMDVVFALNGIAAIEDGDRFVQVVPLAAGELIRSASPERAPDDAVVPREDIRRFRGNLSRGQRTRPSANQKWVYAESGSAESMLKYYAEIVGLTVHSSDQFTNEPVVFAAHTELSRPEIAYTLQTVLQLNQLAIHTSDDGSITLVRASN